MAIFNLPKIKLVMLKNKELFFLVLLFIFSITSTQIYNLNKKKINKNYINLINNIYFQKQVNHIFESLEPRYKIITHTIKRGETFKFELGTAQVIPGFNSGIVGMTTGTKKTLNIQKSY